jgi:hypothetical protein
MAPVIATLADGRRVVAAAAPGQVASVGARVRVSGSPLTYEVVT